MLRQSGSRGGRRSVLGVLLQERRGAAENDVPRPHHHGRRPRRRHRRVATLHGASVAVLRTDGARFLVEPAALADDLSAQQCQLSAVIRKTQFPRSSSTTSRRGPNSGAASPSAPRSFRACTRGARIPRPRDSRRRKSRSIALMDMRLDIRGLVYRSDDKNWLLAPACRSSSPPARSIRTAATGRHTALNSAWRPTFRDLILTGEHRVCICDRWGWSAISRLPTSGRSPSVPSPASRWSHARGRRAPRCRPVSRACGAESSASTARSSRPRTRRSSGWPRDAWPSTTRSSSGPEARNSARHRLRRARSAHDRDGRLPRADRRFRGDRARAPDEDRFAIGSRAKAPTPITTVSPTTSISVRARRRTSSSPIPAMVVPKAADRDNDGIPDVCRQMPGHARRQRRHPGHGWLPRGRLRQRRYPRRDRRVPARAGLTGSRSQGQRMPAVHQARERLDRDRDLEADPVRYRQGVDQAEQLRESATRS